MRTLQLLLLPVVLGGWESAVRKVVQMAADPVLDRSFMNLTEIAADLSLLTYFSNPDNRDGYDSLEIFSNNLDQAIVAKKYGYCFLAFRGTDLSSLADIYQYMQYGKSDVCPSYSPDECCETRTGFSKAYHANYSSVMEASLRNCAATCTDANECVVLTGHSQGGSIAQVAAIMLYDLNPYVFAFGNSPALNRGCPHLNATRWYNFANTRESYIAGLLYDKYTFPHNDRGLWNLGYTLLMSDDTTGMANLGLNFDGKVSPTDPFSILAMHLITTDSDKYPGYRDRIKNIIAADSYPLRSNGFANGYLCTKDIECESGKCERSSLLSHKRCTSSERSYDSFGMLSRNGFSSQKK